MIANAVKTNMTSFEYCLPKYLTNVLTSCVIQKVEELTSTETEVSLTLVLQIYDPLEDTKTIIYFSSEGLK